MASDPTQLDFKDRHHLVDGIADTRNTDGVGEGPPVVARRPFLSFSHGVDNTVAFYSQTSSFSRPLSLSFAHTHALTHTKSDDDVEYEVRYVHFGFPNCAILLCFLSCPFFNPKLGFFRRLCHSKIMLWLSPFTSSDLTYSLEGERDLGVFLIQQDVV